MRGYAPGWQVRCLKCGLKIPAGQAGIVRVGAIGRGYKLGWCSRCRRLRCLAVERVKESSEQTAPNPDAGNHR